MRTVSTQLLRLALIVGSTLVAAPAAAFDSGSTGAFGPLTLAVGETRTVELPPDGVINATTVTLPPASKLFFKRNALNTPVFLLATGDVTISGSGGTSATIDVSGAAPTGIAGGIGGPGGFDGGKGDTIQPGAGEGPGAGGGGECNEGVAGAGNAAHRTVPTTTVSNGTPYGSPTLVPIVGGSGGGGCRNGTNGRGGGGGGGAILIASNTRITVNGNINALGAGSGPGSTNDQTSRGSGGAIRLVAPIVSGTGRLDVLGGFIQTSERGNGRIRIDTFDESGLTATMAPLVSKTSGSAMYVFLPDPPRLDIVAAADQVIAEGSGPVQVTLPLGSPSNRTVTVRATNFTGVVPVTVAVIPESGGRSLVTGQIAMNNQPHAETTVNVTIPANTVTRIQAWTTP